MEQSNLLEPYTYTIWVMYPLSRHDLYRIIFVHVLNPKIQVSASLATPITHDIVQI